MRRRNNDEEHVISNLLNLADGMLSDFYHVQVICTFSKELNQVDPGMIRRGRLLASYNFRELSIEKTIALFKFLGYKEVPEREMTLAEILNYDQSGFGLIRNAQIGF